MVPFDLIEHRDELTEITAEVETNIGWTSYERLPVVPGGA